MKKKKTQLVRKHPHAITFEIPKDARACAMAEAGQSLRHILEEVDLSPCQITYRNHKLAKKYYKYPRGVGLATAWRTGRSVLWKEFGDDIVGIATKRIMEEAAPQFIHPTPKIVEEK